MKLKKATVMLLAVLCAAMFATAASAVTVTTEEELRTAVTSSQTVTLGADITLSDEALIVTNGLTVTLDLNGYTLSRSSETSDTIYAIRVRESATLTINDSTGNGSIETTTTGNQSGRCIEIGYDGSVNGGTVVMNGGTLIADYREPNGSVYGGHAVRVVGNKDYNDRTTSIESVFRMTGGKIQAGMAGVFVYGLTATAIIEGGEIDSYGYGITGNGTNSSTGGNYGGTVIEISGGTVTSQMASAIYQPQAGTITITGGTISGDNGIQMKAGTLIMSGGTLEGTGEFSDDYTYAEGQRDGTIATGAALSLLSEGNSQGSYAGNITVEISGDAVLKSTNGYAIAEAYSNNGNILKFEELKITGGTFIGASDKGAMAIVNATDDNTQIEGGAFSSNLLNCIGLSDLQNLPTMSLDANGYYTAVTEPAKTLAITAESMKVAVGGTLQLTAEMDGANDTVIWESSDENVAAVDQNGLVTGVSVGTVTIYASIKHIDKNDDVYEELSDSIELAVTPGDVTSSGGGCSAGFGSLALLAALPLLRMRKK